VLKAMLAAGAITPGQERRAQLQTIHFQLDKHERDLGGIAYLIDLVLDRLPPLLGTGHAEVVVETTVDSELQRRTQEVVQVALEKRGGDLRASQAAVVLLDMDGGIRAMVGGRSYTDSQFNRAVKAKRQPGSAFKPIVYLAALEQGLTPETRVLDLPLNIEGWAPRNSSGRYRGSVSLRDALAHSVNTVAVRTSLDVGLERVVRMAQRLGIQSVLTSDPSMALGTSEVTLTELTGAYGIIANGGFSILPHVIKRVRSSSGRILYVRDVPRLTQIVAGEHAAAMNDMLHQALVAGTGRQAAFGEHPAAGKTGTTQDFRDAWFVGYTAQFAAGVWVGNDSGRVMNKVTGGGLPAEIWRDVMRAAHRGRAVLPLAGVEHLSATGLATASRVSLPRRGPRDSRETFLAPPTSAAAIPPTPMRPRTPRVGLAHRGGAGAPLPTAGVVSRLPAERIDADFIARALAGLPPMDGEVRPPGSGDAGSAAKTVRQSLPRAMGLGISP
jgi:penicillin-binding protein 1A